MNFSSRGNPLLRSRGDGGAPLSSSGGAHADLSPIALHEAAHCVVARHLGFPIASATIVPGVDYGGRVVAPGVDPGAPLAEQIALAESLCAQAMALRPGPGEPQDDYAPWEVEARGRCLEILAGQEGERLATGEALLPADTDLHLAQLYAATICSSGVVEAFLQYARAEATAILRRHWLLVEAVAAALETRGTLTGSEIDEIISGAITQAEHEQELKRRQWLTAAKSRAKTFLAEIAQEQA